MNQIPINVSNDTTPLESPFHAPMLFRSRLVDTYASVPARDMRILDLPITLREEMCDEHGMVNPYRSTGHQLLQGILW